MVQGMVSYMANITKRGNSYRIKVSCGYDINGKQLTESMTWTPPQGMTPKQIEKEVNKQAVHFEEKCKTGMYINSNINFADFADMWFEQYAEKQLKKKTVARYRELIERIKPAIGHIRLGKMQPQHLLALYDMLEEEGARLDTKYRFKQDFGKILKNYKLTKTTLAQLANVSTTTLDSITKNKNVNLKTAAKISIALNRNIDELFDPINNKKNLSGTTVNHYHKVISSILSTAVQWQIILSNPCQRIKAPKIDSKEASYLDETDAIRLLELLEQEDIRYKTATELLIYTGLRRSELCGLKWDDIDFKKQLLHIRRNLLYLPGEGIFEDTTKNYTSTRTIKISASAIESLKVYRKQQSAQRLSLGDKWEDNNLVFTTWNGKPMHPDSLTSWFSAFIKKHSLPNISIKSLRHTNATLQIASGVPIPTVAKRLGHAKPTTTNKVYAHAIRSADEAAAETLQDILHPTLQNQKHLK